MDKPKQEICTIKILFPVISDDQAFELQKKIKVLFSETPDVNFDFRILSGDLRGPQVQ